MSSFFAIVNTDGRTVESELVTQLLRQLAWRGPDAQSHWSASHVALGYAHLWVDDLTRVPPPLTFDEQVWLAADIRLDARDELCRAIRAASGEADLDMPDARLLWQAYSVWGLDCLHRLQGDFAFALWDAPRRRLFCARDRFAVKPFYYSDRPGLFLASSDLETICAHPEIPTSIPSDLNDFAVADFLIEGMKLDEDGTFYRAIRRLPRATALCLELGRLRQWRYWDWPTDGHLRHARPREYIEHFQTLLEQAVADRLRAPRAAVFLSGGLDSNVVTAAIRRRCPAVNLHAFTNVFNYLIPDDERRFAGLAARAHGIPVTFIAQDDWRPYALHPALRQPPPEPVHEPFWNGIVESYHQATAHARIIFTGQWGDEVLSQETAPYLRDLVARRQFITLGKSLLTYFIADSRNNFFSLRRQLRRWFKPPSPTQHEIPRWLATAFVTRLRQAGYFERRRPQSPPHPYRQVMLAVMSRVHMVNDHEYSDVAFTGALAEMRYPLLDQRIIEFLLTAPAVPVCLDKWLFREALKPQLPPGIVRRAKTPLRQFPITGYIARHGTEWALDFARDAAWEHLTGFVDGNAIRQPLIWDKCNEASSFVDLSPKSLYKWLQLKVS
ncbi:MAG: asparagine synthetase B family protein [Acidobacteriota bacterium]